MRTLAIALGLFTFSTAYASPRTKVTVVTLEAQPTIERTIQAKPGDLGGVIAGAVITLMTIAEQHALGVSGPPFAKRWRRSAESISVDIGVTIRNDASTIALPADIRAGRLPPGRAAVLVWQGRHDTLPKGHMALDAWLTANSYKASGTRWEVFVTNPIQTPDPDAQETRIVAPLATVVRR